MLVVDSLSFDYQDKPLLSNVNFSLEQGQLMHLRGANGTGKTTLMRLLVGLLRPLEGEIRYKGKNIQANLNTYQYQLCYIGHKTGINPQLTVKENCYFDLHWGRRLSSFKELFEPFGLEGFENEPCYLLSAGQKRRLSLLKLMMTDALLWLLDEPLNALDEKGIQALMTCLRTHKDNGGIVILTSHQNLPLGQNYLEYFL